MLLAFPLEGKAEEPASLLDMPLRLDKLEKEIQELTMLANLNQIREELASTREAAALRATEVTSKNFEAALARIESDISRTQSLFQLFMGVVALIGLLIAFIGVPMVSRLIEVKITERIAGKHEEIAEKVLAPHITSALQQWEDRFNHWDKQMVDLYGDMSKQRDRSTGGIR